MDRVIGVFQALADEHSNHGIEEIRKVERVR